MNLANQFQFPHDDVPDSEAEMDEQQPETCDLLSAARNVVEDFEDRA